jgi:hypothetical protein
MCRTRALAALACRICWGYTRRAGLETSFARYGGTMPRVKQASTKKRVTKAAVPVVGAAGLTLSLVGGASAAAVPTANVQPLPNVAPGHQVTLGEEEISDVSLATFYVFDKENTAEAAGGVRLARGGCGCGHGCGGHGCGHGCGGGCRGCGCRCAGGCGCGCGVGGCCASWGACRWC